MEPIFGLVLTSFGLIFLSLAVSSLGVIKENVWLSVSGAVLFVPCAYMMAVVIYPYGLGFVLTLFQFGSAAAVRQKNPRWAWYLLVPSFLVTIRVLIEAWTFFA